MCVHGRVSEKQKERRSRKGPAGPAGPHVRAGESTVGGPRRCLEGHVGGPQICLIVRISQRASRREKVDVAKPHPRLNWNSQGWGPDTWTFKNSSSGPDDWPSLGTPGVGEPLFVSDTAKQPREYLKEAGSQPPSIQEL